MVTASIPSLSATARATSSVRSRFTGALFATSVGLRPTMSLPLVVARSLDNLTALGYRLHINLTPLGIAAPDATGRAQP